MNCVQKVSRSSKVRAEKLGFGGMKILCAISTKAVSVD